MPWFVSGGQPVYTSDPMNMLGQTIGSGVTPASPAMSTAATAAMNDAIMTEMRRQWDADHQQKQQQLDQNYEIAKRNAATAEEAREIDRWYREQSMKLERDRMAQEDRHFGQNLEQRRYEFGETMGLNRAKLGYDLIGTAAQLRGPADYFQAANYARGVAGAPETATFLSALQNNSRMAGFGGQAGLPDKETLGTLTAKLQGGGNPNEGNYLAQIGNIAAKGAHRLGGGALEQLTPTEQQLFASGLGEIGVDVPTFLSQYRRSRIGNRFSNASAA